MDADEIRRARDGIADTLASIEREDLDASVGQALYLQGAADALDFVIDDGEKSKD